MMCMTWQDIQSGWRVIGTSALLAVILLCSLAGCNTNATLRQAQAVYRVGDLRAASMHINSYVQNESKDVDRVIAHLEQGTIRRELGDLPGSEASYQVADDTIERIDAKPDVSVSQEAYATVTNLNNLTYRGYHYDRVMLSVYRALNNMQQAQFEAARVNLIRAYNRQGNAVVANTRRIEKAQQTADNVAREKKVNMARTQSDPGFTRLMNQQYGELSKYHVYSDYVNPFAEWLQGLYFFADAADESDMDRARKSMERTAAMVPANEYVHQDQQMLQGDRNAIEPLTYVIFATGTAPMRGEIRLDIPVFLFARDVDYVGANFPKLLFNANFMRQLNINVQGQHYATQLLADMDSIVAQEFENDLPVVITRTIISSASKAAIAYGMRQTVSDQDSIEALAIRIAAAAYQVATNEADLRTWVSLPKQFQIARFPTPSSRTFIVEGGPTGGKPVTLQPGFINVVFVRSIAPYVPMEISQFSFGKGSSTWQTALQN